MLFMDHSYLYYKTKFEEISIETWGFENMDAVLELIATLCLVPW